MNIPSETRSTASPLRIFTASSRPAAPVPPRKPTVSSTAGVNDRRWEYDCYIKARCPWSRGSRGAAVARAPRSLSRPSDRRIDPTSSSGIPTSTTTGSIPSSNVRAFLRGLGAVGQGAGEFALGPSLAGRDGLVEQGDHVVQDPGRRLGENRQQDRVAPRRLPAQQCLGGQAVAHGVGVMVRRVRGSAN